MSDDKFVRAITRLIHMTQGGNIEWKYSSPKTSMWDGIDTPCDVVYSTTLDNNLVRLYRYKYEEYIDESYGFPVNDVALEISNLEGKSWWKFPMNRIIYDLLDTVQRKTANVDSFIDKLLSEGD